MSKKLEIEVGKVYACKFGKPPLFVVIATTDQASSSSFTSSLSFKGTVLWGSEDNPHPIGTHKEWMRDEFVECPKSFTDIVGLFGIDKP